MVKRHKIETLNFIKGFCLFQIIMRKLFVWLSKKSYCIEVMGMAIRIKMPDHKPIFLQTGNDREFINLTEGELFDMPDDFPAEFKGKYIVEKLIRDNSPLENHGDMLVVKRMQ